MSKKTKKVIDREAQQNVEPRKKADRGEANEPEIKREEPTKDDPIDDDGFGLPKSRLKW